MLPLHARQPRIQPLELVAEALMVDAALVEDRGVDVVQVRGVGGDVVAEVIALAVGGAAFDAAAGHPHAEVSRMVIATVIRLRQTALRIDCPAKFTSPDDERAV